MSATVTLIRDGHLGQPVSPRSEKVPDQMVQEQETNKEKHLSVLSVDQW